jgi:hypothetical protein
MRSEVPYSTRSVSASSWAASASMQSLWILDFSELWHAEMVSSWLRILDNVFAVGMWYTPVKGMGLDLSLISAQSRTPLDSRNLDSLHIENEAVFLLNVAAQHLSHKGWCICSPKQGTIWTQEFSLSGMQSSAWIARLSVAVRVTNAPRARAARS